MVNNVYVSAVTQDNISRHDLLAWVNNNLQSNLSKIEEMATGAAYCQLTAMLFRDKINLKKVKWNTRSELDSINNWKILTTAWKEIGVDKPVQVDRLLKAKFQDNFEFLQWFYKFFNANYDGEPYDAVEARGGEALPALTTKGGVAAPAAARPAARPALAPRAAAPAPALAKKTNPAPSVAATAARPSNGGAATAGAKAATGKAADNNDAVVKELRTQLAEQQEVAVTIENERDFYFNKLRHVELMCTAAKEKGMAVDVDKILSILYATEDVAVPEVLEESLDEHNENIALQESGVVEEGLEDQKSNLPTDPQPLTPTPTSTQTHEQATNNRPVPTVDDDEETF